MASKEQCAAALDDLCVRLSEVDEQVRHRHALDRRVECRLSDLSVTFSARLVDGELVELVELVEGTAGRPQVRFTLVSDDLLAMTQGTLGLATAWASGRLRVEAPVLDLLRLRSFI